MFGWLRTPPSVVRNELPATEASPPAQERPVWTSFEHLVPGWDAAFVYPDSVAVEAGIRAEMERLQGCCYVVAVFHRDMHYDSLPRALFIDQGFLDIAEAEQHAQRVLDRHGEMTCSEFPGWKALEGNPWPWPAMVPLAANVLRLSPRLFGDGSGYYTREVCVAVIPVDPEQPLSADLFRMVADSIAVSLYLRHVGEGVLGHAQWEALSRQRRRPAVPLEPVRIPSFPQRIGPRARASINRGFSLLLGTIGVIVWPLYAFVNARDLVESPRPGVMPFLNAYASILFLSGFACLLALRPGIQAYKQLPAPRPLARRLELALIALPVAFSVVVTLALWIGRG